MCKACFGTSPLIEGSVIGSSDLGHLSVRGLKVVCYGGLMSVVGWMGLGVVFCEEST